MYQLPPYDFALYLDLQLLLLHKIQRKANTKKILLTLIESHNNNVEVTVIKPKFLRRTSDEWFLKTWLSLSPLYRKEEQGDEGKYVPWPAVEVGQGTGVLSFPPDNTGEIQQAEDPFLS